MSAPDAVRDDLTGQEANAIIRWLTAERDALIAACITRVWLGDSPPEECVYEWQIMGMGGIVRTRAEAVAAVRRAAGLDGEDGRS